MKNKKSFLWVCDNCCDENWPILTIGRILDDRICQWCGRQNVETYAVSTYLLIKKYGKREINGENNSWIY